jgi:hypothetical protein
MPIPRAELESDVEYWENLEKKFTTYMTQRMDKDKAYSNADIEPMLYEFLTQEGVIAKENRKPTDEPRGIDWMIHGNQIKAKFFAELITSKLFKYQTLGSLDYYTIKA